MICVDTSVWIAALGDATGAGALHLSELVDANVVAVPAPVRVEILAGAPRRAFADLVDGFLGITQFVPGGPTWELVEHWVSEAVAAGQRFGVVDLLIAATAAEHGATLWSLDADFARMQKLGFVQLYASP